MNPKVNALLWMPEYRLENECSSVERRYGGLQRRGGYELAEITTRGGSPAPILQIHSMLPQALLRMLLLAPCENDHHFNLRSTITTVVLKLSNGSLKKKYDYCEQLRVRKLPKLQSG